MEKNVDDPTWMESYKKLKIKIKGAKIVEEKKQVIYYNNFPQPSPKQVSDKVLQ